MHNKRLQLARTSHWHIVINAACMSNQSEEAQSNLGVGWAGGGRSDPGIIVGDCGPSQAVGWDGAQVSREH